MLVVVVPNGDCCIVVVVLSNYYWLCCHVLIQLCCYVLIHLFQTVKNHATALKMPEQKADFPVYNLREGLPLKVLDTRKRLHNEFIQAREEFVESLIQMNKVRFRFYVFTCSYIVS